MSSSDWLSRKLILIMGKGGVGKTTLAQAAAQHLASQGKRVLLIHVLQLSDEHEQKLEKLGPNLWTTTLQSSECFREYIIMKLRVKTLYTAFLGNKITQYMEKAAPGVREIVLLGKVWFERANYDHVIADMPSTGYALTLIHTPFNFAALFPGGPIYKDSKDMIETFSNPNETAFVTVSLAEEMPVQESADLAANLKEIMPRNPSRLVVNRLVRLKPEERALHASHWPKLAAEERRSPLWSGLDYLVSREQSQGEQLEALKTLWAPFTGSWMEIEEVPAKDERSRSAAIAGTIKSGGVDATR